MHCVTMMFMHTMCSTKQGQRKNNAMSERGSVHNVRDVADGAGRVVHVTFLTLFINQSYLFWRSQSLLLFCSISCLAAIFQCFFFLQTLKLCPARLDFPSTRFGHFARSSNTLLNVYIQYTCVKNMVSVTVISKDMMSLRWSFTSCQKYKHTVHTQWHTCRQLVTVACYISWLYTRAISRHVSYHSDKSFGYLTCLILSNTMWGSLKLVKKTIKPFAFHSKETQNYTICLSAMRVPSICVM